MKYASPLLAVSLLVSGCSGGDDTSASPTPEVTPTPAAVLGAISVIDNNTLDPLQGVKVSVGGKTSISDSRGTVPIDSPASGPFMVKFDDPSGDYPIHKSYLNGWDGEWDMDQGIIKTTDANAIGSYFNVQMAPSRASLVVSIWWQEENYDITEMYGATIDLSSDYEISLVQNSNEDSGWYQGNTILQDADYATVIFGNVDPGDAYVYVDTPEAVGTCGAWPSEYEDGWNSTIPLEAGDVGVYAILCTRASAARSATPEQMARASGQRPFARLDLGLQVQKARNPGEPLRLTGQVASEGGGRSAFHSSFDLRATYADVPTEVSLKVEHDGNAMQIDLDRERQILHLQLGSQRLSVTYNPDGTYSLDERVLPGAGRPHSLMAGDARLSRVTEPMLIAWMAGLHALDLEGRTRFVTQGGLTNSLVTTTHLPGQLGCLKFGPDSLSCQLGQTLDGATR